MIEDILTGAFIGGLGGIITGFLIAVFTREGIWPDVWARMIILFAVVGGILGVF